VQDCCIAAVHHRHGECGTALREAWSALHVVAVAECFLRLVLVNCGTIYLLSTEWNSR
jgi:hypothetical protein